MRCFSVNSGSNGNCIYVEAAGRRPVRLLFDAGISGKQTALRLAEHGVNIAAIDAVIISHDHTDHVCCAGVLARKHHLPIYMTPKTYCAASGYGLGAIDDLRLFEPGATLVFDQVRVDTHPTPHDAAEPVVTIVQADQRRLGILTDLGCVFDRLPDLLADLDGVFLESNYDPDMLHAGPYPPHLKRRIAGPQGHISNQECAHLVRDAAGARLQWVALAHLSETNNTPELAWRTHHRLVGGLRPIHVAPRDRVGASLEIV